MPVKDNTPTYQHVLNEQQQQHPTRKSLFLKLENALEMPVITFFTSFSKPVMIDDYDADMIEGILQKVDCTKGLALLINSPGGIGESAERIINICKNYSGTKEFIVIVPGKAKSAATIICMGASKIYMGRTSELGPVDPQVTINKVDNKTFYAALFNIVKSYDDLFDRAVNTTGNLQPYLQQLSNYDEREIAEMKTAILLSEDIAIRALAAGMMKGTTPENIKTKIQVFLTPEIAKSHGRSIFCDEAKACGLNIEIMEAKSIIWKLSYELFVRTDNLTKSTNAAKCVESKNHSYSVSV